MESTNYTPHAISDLLSAISDLLSGYDGSCHCEDLGPTCDPASSKFPRTSQAVSAKWYCPHYPL